MSVPPPHKPLREITAHHITAGDTVKLAVLTGPRDGSPTTVVFEIWEPGGAQPRAPSEWPATTGPSTE